jgi:hypothetical protein
LPFLIATVGLVPGGPAPSCSNAVEGWCMLYL